MASLDVLLIIRLSTSSGERLHTTDSADLWEVEVTVCRPTIACNLQIHFA